MFLIWEVTTFDVGRKTQYPGITEDLFLCVITGPTTDIVRNTVGLTLSYDLRQRSKMHLLKPIKAVCATKTR